MKKAKLIKKDTLLPEQLPLSRKARKLRGHQVNPTRTAIDITTEWIKRRREESGNARESFAALFSKSDPDPQSA